MGFLDRLTGGSDEDQAREQRVEEDVARIVAGGIPLAAEQRIAELGQGERFFTSGLSVADFALTRGEQIRPVSQVMGSSVYKVGWQNYPWGGSWRNQPKLTELDQLTNAWNEARRLALDRLQQEAEHAGCHAVLDVTFERRDHDFLADAVEVVVNGTAVHLPGRRPPGSAPVLTDLSMPDYVLLTRGGYRPLGVVASTSVFYIVPGWTTRQATTGWRQWNNQELTDFTQGVYEARERALTRATAQAERLGAAGLVGMSIDHHVAIRRVGSESNEREDLIVTFHVLGTAIAPTATHQPIEPTTIIRLGGRPA